MAGTNRYNSRKIGTISVCLALVFAFMPFFFFAYAADGAEKKGTSSEISVKDLEGKTIGMQTGTIYDKYINVSIPGAKIEYFNTFTDEINALKARKIDGVAATETTLDQLMKQDSSITTAKETLGGVGTCFLFPKNEKGKVIEKPVTYFADFVYTDEHGNTVVEDAKSPATRTPAYVIKRKLMLSIDGIRIREV